MNEILKPNTNSNELSLLPIPVGFSSPDGSITVGREGYLFLIGGSNHLAHQYVTDENHPLIVKDAEDWINLITARLNSIEAMGCRFLQIIIPEKTSVLADLVPLDINAPTGRYKQLVRRLNDSSILNKNVIDCYKLFINSNSRKECYRKVDSHFSVMGASLVFAEVLKYLDFDLRVPSSFTHQIFAKADLGHHLYPAMTGEYVKTLTPLQSAELSDGVEIVDSIISPDGKHIGTRLVFRRRNAPINLKVIAFANSFFERGGAPSGLTWWFARIFTEFHFIWSPEVDLDYVEKNRPNIVIAQTIERFISRVPKF